MIPDIKPAGGLAGEYNQIWESYYHNVLYDVVMAVRGCRKWGPNYKDIGNMLPYRTDTIVNFLRHAETLRYITGKFGYYSKHGGGAKCWFMSDPADYAEKADLYGALYAGKVPPYPYDWLNLVAEQGDNLTEYLKAHAIIVYNRDTMDVKYIARSLVDLEVAYKVEYVRALPYMSRPKLDEYIKDKVPSPVIMSYYGKRASPTPTGIKDYCTGALDWYFPLKDLEL